MDECTRLQLEMAELEKDVERLDAMVAEVARGILRQRRSEIVKECRLLIDMLELDNQIEAGELDDATREQIEDYCAVNHRDLPPDDIEEIEKWLDETT